VRIQLHNLEEFFGKHGFNENVAQDAATVCFKTPAPLELLLEGVPVKGEYYGGIRGDLFTGREVWQQAWFTTTLRPETHIDDLLSGTSRGRHDFRTLFRATPIRKTPRLVGSRPDQTHRSLRLICRRKLVKIRKDGYEEPATVPKAPRAVLLAAVEQAVERGKLWLTSGHASILAEPIPNGLLTISTSATTTHERRDAISTNRRLDQPDRNGSRDRHRAIQ
jgi:hypothetical protein